MILFIQYASTPDTNEEIQMQVSGDGWIALYDVTMPEIRKLRESIENVLAEWPIKMEYGDLGSIGYADLDLDDIPF